MKIGLDIDGVILDYERVIRAKAELYDLLELKGEGLVNKDELKIHKRYDWTEEETDNFINKYFLKLNEESPLVAGAKEVINYLKQDGHELIVITARCPYVKEMRDAAKEIFERENLTFDKIYFDIKDKSEICKEENIDIMIDDYYVTCKELAENKIMTLYFRDVDLKKLEETEYLKEVNNWGEIYRHIRNYKL